MQIPGLSLLNGSSPVVAVLLNESSAPSAENPRSPTPGDPEADHTLSVPHEIHLDESYLGDGPVNGPGTHNGESIETDTASLAVARLSPDPLDVALADNSVESANNSEQANEEEAAADSVDEFHPLCADEELEALIKAAPSGALQGLEDEYDENEDGGNTKDIGATGLRTKNEVAEELGPVNLIDISITDQTVIEYLGTVERVMESVAIVRAHTNGEYRILDEGGVIVTESRSLVGTIAETFGPVKEPRYLVRLAENLSASEHPAGNQRLYYVPEFASYVFTQAIRGLKGSDASNFYDEEVNDEEKEFSDDEAEIAHKRNLKRKRGQDSARKSVRPGQDQGTSSNRSTSVDQGQGIHYRPLSRPNTSSTAIDRYAARPARNPAENRSSYIDREVSDQQQRHLNDPYYPPNLPNPTLYNQGPSREQPFPQSRTFYGYNEPTAAHRTLSPTEVNSGMPNLGHYPPLPPGAYVNPAFFRPNQPTNLPSDIQQQMEMLYNLPRQPPSG